MSEIKHQIDKIKISNNPNFSNFNDTIDTTGRINEKLSSKINKKDLYNNNFITKNFKYIYEETNIFDITPLL